MSSPVLGGFSVAAFVYLPDRLRCPVCRGGLRNPRQTPCGHRICERCLQLTQGPEVSKSCPACGRKLASNEVFPDNAVKNEVLSLTVKCSGCPPCDWTGELRKLASHQSDCLFVKVACHLTCGEWVSRRDIESHVHENCLKRKVRCEHCKMEMERRCLDSHLQNCLKTIVPCPQGCSIKNLMRGEVKSHVSVSEKKCPHTIVACIRSPICKWSGKVKEREKHDDECPHMILMCPLKCGQSVTRLGMANHTDTVCIRGVVLCNHCELKVEREHFQNHYKGCPKFPVVCPQGCIAQLTRCKVEGHIREECPETMADCIFQNVGCSIRRKRKFMDDHMEKEIVKHLAWSHKKMALSQSQITEMKEELRSVDFSYCWKVTEWSKKSLKTEDKGAAALWSDPFYIKQPGHRMKLKLEFSKSSGIGISMIPTEGEYDQVIKWPFRQKYSLVVVDQRRNGLDRKYVVEKEILDRIPDSFLASISKGIGVNTIVRPSEIDNFVKDDCLLVKVTVYSW